MKKKWIIGAVIVLLLAIAAVVVVLIMKPNDAPQMPSETVSITEHCWEHVTNMKVIEQDNGTAEVTLTAPDYVIIIKALADENQDADISELVKKIVETNPKVVKEYIFTASSSAEFDVKYALMEQISYELIALTLERMNG